MKPYELVAKTIRGENDTGITPTYGWLSANLSELLETSFGSVLNFEETYQFDLHHAFGGPSPFDAARVEALRAAGEEITPQVLLDLPMNPVDYEEDYRTLREQFAFYRGERGRFCYVQSNGLFECLNTYFGIEDHLCWLALYPDEIKELYERLANWNIRFENNVMDLGADMVHISDDWGSQRSLLFSPDMYSDLILPPLSRMAAAVKQRGRFLSLHSDGCILEAVPYVADLGFDLLHPWQENAGMSLDVYCENYADRFALLGGICVQSTLGFGDFARLESEIRRVFAKLKGKRWICCTSHFVQNHCSLEELVFCYDLVNRLAGKGKGTRAGY